jgi:hypothetical protein
LKNVHIDLVAFIRKFDAHSGGDSLLYALGSLAGPNKHQRILGISISNNGLAVKVRPGGSGQIVTPFKSVASGFEMTGPFVISGNWNELHNELEILRIGKDGNLQGNVEIAPVLEIVIGTGKAPLSGPAAAMFGDFARKVESIVLGIEAETARIRDTCKPGL